MPSFEIRLWCNRCERETIHRVEGADRGKCLVCLQKREKQMSLPGTVATEPEQMPLIDIALGNWRGDK